MAPPKITWQISLGHIIQIVTLVVAVTLAWAQMRSGVLNNGEALNIISNRVEEVRDADDDHAHRLRILETTDARRGEQLKNILILLEKIDGRMARLETRTMQQQR